MEESGILFIRCSHIYLMLHCCSMATNSQVQQQLAPHQQKQDKMITSGSLMPVLSDTPSSPLINCIPIFRIYKLTSALDTTEDTEDWSRKQMPLSSARADCNFCQTALAKLVLTENLQMGWSRCNIMTIWTGKTRTAWDCSQLVLK